jgi:hypothetical protein
LLRRLGLARPLPNIVAGALYPIIGTTEPRWWTPGADFAPAVVSTLRGRK